MSIRILDQAAEDLVEGFFFKDDHIFIHAVVDCRRSPAWIRRHLK